MAINYTGDVHGIRDFYNAMENNNFLRKFNFRLRSVNTNALTLNETEIIYSHCDLLPARKIENFQQPFMGLNLKIGRAHV